VSLHSFSRTLTPACVPGYVKPGNKYAGQETIKVLVRSELVSAPQKAMSAACPRVYLEYSLQAPRA
jgi:hypothetical protein